MIKTGIYVDGENIRMCGGYGMRYDVLMDFACSGDSMLLRANSYLAEDRERARDDSDYRAKVHRYHQVIRQCGFKVIKKYVKHFVDDEGILTTKANADMDLAIDALLQARNLDRVILLTGDGDFIRLVLALQNMGCRVEVIGFKHVSTELREAADAFLSGYLIPGLLPIGGPHADNRLRGMPINYNPDRGFGFMRYYTLDRDGLHPHSVFFHCSKAVDVGDQLFLDATRVFEFTIAVNPDDNRRTEALDIRLLDESSPVAGVAAQQWSVNGAAAPGRYRRQGGNVMPFSFDWQQLQTIVAAYGLDIVGALLILFIGRWLASRLVRLFVRLLEARQVDVTLTRFFEGIVYYTLLAAVVIAAAGQAGVKTTSFIAVRGAASRAVGLALKDSLANFSSGVMLILFRPFAVGDWVTVAGETGEVEKISVFSTVLNTADNQRKIIPNGEIANKTITNITANPTRRIDIVVGIGYGDDIRLAKETLAAVIAVEPRLLPEPEPLVAVAALAESSVDLVLRAWVATDDFWSVQYALLERVKLAFDERGITIPYPQRQVTVIAGGPLNGEQAAETGVAGC